MTCSSGGRPARRRVGRELHQPEECATSLFHPTWTRPGGDLAGSHQNMLESSLMARALVLLVAAIVSFGLVVAASADPPDPTWIAGFWDDDDQDTAVIAVLSIPGWVAPADPSFIPFLIVDPLAVISMRPCIRTSVFAAVESRGPPLSPKRPL